MKKEMTVVRVDMQGDALHSMGGRPAFANIRVIVHFVGDDRSDATIEFARLQDAPQIGDRIIISAERAHP